MAVTTLSHYYTPADLKLLSAKEGMGFGIPPAAGDTNPSGGGKIWQEWVLDAKTSTVRTNEEVNEFSGVAADQFDDLELTHHSETTISAEWRGVGVASESLGSLMGAGATLTGISSGAASDTISGSAAPYTHLMLPATVSNRTGPHHFWHDVGDHDHPVEVRGAMPKSWAIGFGPTQSIRVDIAFDGLTELVPYDGLFTPSDNSILKKIAVDTGYIDSSPYTSDMFRMNITAPSGNTYDPFIWESGSITIDRDSSPDFGSWSNSFTPAGTPTVSGTTITNSGSGSGGPPNGTYYYIFTAVMPNKQESAVGAKTYTNAGTAHPATIANLPTIPAGGAVNIYRSAIGNSTGPYYLIATLYTNNYVLWTAGSSSYVLTAGAATTISDVNTDANLSGATAYLANALLPPGNGPAHDPLDITTGMLRVTGSGILTFNGLGAGQMWQDYRDYNSAGTANGPQVFGFRNPLGYGMKLTSYPVKWTTFDIDRTSGNRLMATVAWTCLADRAAALGNTPANSKVSATVWSPSNRPFVF